MTKTLILGASGYLGSRLFTGFDNSYGTYYSSSSSNKSHLYRLDALDTRNLSTLINDISPDIVINCIGLTNVDSCENYPEKSWMINCELPGEVAKICSLRGVKFVQISTDHYVKDKDTKILETDAVSSINQYGFTKLSAEKLVLSLNPNAMILRTNFFHFNLSDPQTFLDNLILNCKNNIITQSFSDVWFSPVSTRTLVLYLKKLLEINFSGLINVSSNEIISKYEFHQQVLNCFGVSNNSHKPISVTKASLKALRPKNMSLDNSKLINATKITMPNIYDMIMEEI